MKMRPCLFPYVTYITIPILLIRLQRFPLPRNKKGFATLNIYNLKGQLIKTLLKDNILSGEHKLIWDGKDNQGNNVASGVYLYKLNMNGSSQIKKMLLLK